MDQERRRCLPDRYRPLVHGQGDQELTTSVRAPVLHAAADLSPAAIRRIAAGGSARIAPQLRAQLRDSCARAREALRRGGPVYGVNTGLGALSGVRLTPAQQRSHQRNLMLARASGGPPWLDPAEVRALIAVRLRTFLSGDAGVSAELCQHLLDVLDSGLVPAVPRTGVGSAGEILPLAHAFGPLAGIGRVLAGPGGGTRPARDALPELGLSTFAFGPKEGIALLAGIPGATALSVLRLSEARDLVGAMEAAAALSIVATGAPRDPYLSECARGDARLAGVLSRLRRLSGDGGQPAILQAPVSFRVAGPVLAHVLRAASALAAAIQRALRGVTDSPAFLGGRFVGTAGFHGIDVSAHCDQLTASLAHAAEVSAARIHRLLDPRVTGLPPQLAPRPGPDTGLVTVHKRAAGEVHALRRMSTPAPVGLIETSGGQEDVQSFAWEATETLRRALGHTRAVTACELLTAYQAISLSGRQAPPASRPVLDRLAAVLGPIGGDRPFGEDIENLSGAIATGLRGGAGARDGQPGPGPTPPAGSG